MLQGVLYQDVTASENTKTTTTWRSSDNLHWNVISSLADCLKILLDAVSLHGSLQPQHQDAVTLANLSQKDVVLPKFPGLTLSSELLIEMLLKIGKLFWFVTYLLTECKRTLNSSSL